MGRTSFIFIGVGSRFHGNICKIVVLVKSMEVWWGGLGSLYPSLCNKSLKKMLKQPAEMKIMSH